MTEPLADTAAHKPKTVTIEVNNKPFEAPKAELTGAEIKELAGIPLDFQLFLLHGESTNMDLVENDEQVKLHEHQRFRAVSGHDVS